MFPKVIFQFNFVFSSNLVLNGLVETPMDCLVFSQATINKDENNNPVEDAWVTLLMGNDIIFASKMTDPSGNVFFHIENIPEGNISITVTKQNRIPHEGSISVNDVILPVNVVSSNISISDIYGCRSDFGFQIFANKTKRKFDFF